MAASYYIRNKYGTTRWYRYHNVVHREDGPAVEYFNHTKQRYNSYALDGKWIGDKSNYEKHLSQMSIK